MIVLRINLRAVFRPLCWLTGHVWKDYLVATAWCSEGRFCERCRKEQLVKYGHEFVGGETIHTRTDWTGTTRFKWVEAGNGSARDPLRYERLSADSESVDGESR